MYVKNAILWDVTPYDSCKNRRFGETLRLHHQSDNNRCTMMKELRCSETSVFTRTTRRVTPEDGILQCHRCENFKSYIKLTVLAMQRRRGVSPVRYELSFYIPEDGILHSHHRGTGWTLYRRRNVSALRNGPGFYIPQDGILHSHRSEYLKSYIVKLGLTNETSDLCVM
jgi:hypothetical protein